VLDVNLGGDRSFGVAEDLARRGVPFLFATGYGRDGTKLEHPEVQVVTKPYRRQEMESELIRLLWAEV